jgi:hypothetical protein
LQLPLHVRHLLLHQLLVLLALVLQGGCRS